MLLCLIWRACYLKQKISFIIRLLLFFDIFQVKVNYLCKEKEMQLKYVTL